MCKNIWLEFKSFIPLQHISGHLRKYSKIPVKRTNRKVLNIPRIELTADDYASVLAYLKNDVGELYDMYGNTEDFASRVREMVLRHGNVPGFKTWASGILRELREEKERESKEQDKDMLYLQAQNDLLIKQMHDVFDVHGNVDNDDPLLAWLTAPWVFRIEKALKMCHNHPETAQVLSMLISSGNLTRPIALNKEFLKACIPHLTNYSHPVTPNSLWEGVRKILNQS